MSLLMPHERMALTIAKRHLRDFGHLNDVGPNTLSALVGALDRIDQETDVPLWGPVDHARCCVSSKMDKMRP